MVELEREKRDQECEVKRVEVKIVTTREEQSRLKTHIERSENDIEMTRNDLNNRTKDLDDEKSRSKQKIRTLKDEEDNRDDLK